MRASTIFSTAFIVLLGAANSSGQALPSQLQIGTPIERSLATGQSHSYSISLGKDQLVQLVIDQKGIDVMVRVFSPAARTLCEVDSPNGTEGPENVEFIARAAGNYRIEVAPLGQFENAESGHYEIRVVELRNATEQELQAARNKETSSAKVRALLIDTTQSLDQLHQPQTRAEIQIKAAQLLWKYDEKRASTLMTQAMESIKELIANVDDREQEYYESFQVGMQLRQRVIEVLAPRDPEAALNFLRSTRMLKNPYQSQNGQQSQELQLELSLVNRVIPTDPKRALEMAEDTLKLGSSASLVETLTRLRSKDRELAAKLAHDIAKKLTGQNLLKTPEAGLLATNFLRVARSPVNQVNGGDSNSNASLVSEDEYRELFQKIVSEVLSYSPPQTNSYTPERDVAQNLVNTIKQMRRDLQLYAPDRAEEIDRKLTQFNNPTEQQNVLWQRYQTAINEGTVESALESATQAPAQMREQLYQQIANKVATSGDFPRARQILTDSIANPIQLQQALRSLDQQAIYAAITRGKLDEALRLLTNFRPVSERNGLLGQIVDQFGPGYKRATALLYLEQARNLVAPTGQAQDQQQMQALLGIARAIARYDINRAYEILDPLLNQFNEISAAAVTLNGFGQKFYRDGELITMNGNAVAETADQISRTLATLALINFDQAKAATERIRQLDIRLRAFLAIAQRIVEGKLDDDED